MRVIWPFRAEQRTASRRSGVGTIPLQVLGFIAVTDPRWYECLLGLDTRLGPMDANFWPATLAPGTPLLFKLRAPANAIAGFGYFATLSVLPDWLAWDTFGEANATGRGALIASGLVLFAITLVVNMAARAIIYRRREFRDSAA